MALDKRNRYFIWWPKVCRSTLVKLVSLSCNETVVNNSVLFSAGGERSVLSVGRGSYSRQPAGRVHVASRHHRGRPAPHEALGPEPITAGLRWLHHGTLHTGGGWCHNLITKRHHDSLNKIKLFLRYPMCNMHRTKPLFSITAKRKLDVLSMGLQFLCLNYESDFQIASAGGELSWHKSRCWNTNPVRSNSFKAKVLLNGSFHCCGGVEGGTEVQ